MDLSGIIFVVLAVAWAVYLVPKALKHHDEVARTRSIDRFSTAMRVLARREPVNRRDARLVVTPPRPAGTPRIIVPTPASTPASSAAGASPERREAETPTRSASSPAPGQRSAARRAAARSAARRRRRVLSLLLAADVVVGALAGLGVLAWWSPALPVALTVLFLVVCRTQVRRDSDASWTRDLTEGSPAASHPAPRRAIRVEAPYGTPTTTGTAAPGAAAPVTAATIVASRNEQGFEEVSEDEDTVAIPAAAVAAGVAAPSLGEADAAAARATQSHAVAVSVPTADGGSLWDPLPMTLPTYVSKPKAARTVRTINLDAPGTWSSGRSEADSRLVEQAEAQEEAQERSIAEQDQQRAVGS